MRTVIVGILALALSGCMAREDAGVRAAKMEAQDDAACKGRSDYGQCRRNLMSYRQQATLDEQARAVRAEASLRSASQALQNINPTPQTVNVSVSCSYGRC